MKRQFITKRCKNTNSTSKTPIFPENIRKNPKFSSISSNCEMQEKEKTGPFVFIPSRILYPNISSKIAKTFDIATYQRYFYNPFIYFKPWVFRFIFNCCIFAEII